MWQQRTATGAVFTAMSLGVRTALAGREEAVAIVRDVDLPPFDPTVAVEFHPGDGPEDSWVVIRPWLLP